MFSVQRILSFVMFSASIVFAPVMTPATELTNGCGAPQILLPQDQIRHGEGRWGEAHCYRLDLESSGFLYLHVATDWALPSGARLEVFEMKGAMEKPAPLRTFLRTATERLTLLEAGTFLVEIRSEDPRRPLPAYRLGSRFVAITPSETNGELELELEESETNGELELELEEIVTNGGLGLELEESEPGGGVDRIWALFKRLCQIDRADDHGDTLACATPFEHRATGEFANGWGDDVDVFRFEVHRWQTVEIIITAELDTHGMLFDRRGQGLGSDDGGGEDESFRLVRTLGPGTYFVGVEEMGSEGSYSLEIRTLGR